jgi:basic membrane protein A
MVILAVSTAGAGPAKETSKAARKVGLILTTAGLGDNNFNDMAYRGMEMAEKELKIAFDYGEPASVSDYEMQLRSFATDGNYELIIAIGADQIEAMKVVAKDFPSQKFTIIDGALEIPNVHSIFTKFEEQTFLTGVLAGLMTGRSGFPMIKANQKMAGIIIGMDFPTLRNAVAGFTAGAQYVDPSIEILTGNVGSFSDPGKAKEMALSMYQKGADFIQLMAGGSGLGIINAAVEARAYAFGVGANQNSIQPDYIAATAVRNVHEIVFNDIKNLVNGNWKPAADVWGIKESAVGYTTEGSNVKLPDDVVKTIETVRQRLVKGEITIPNEVEAIPAWLKNNHL